MDRPMTRTKTENHELSPSSCAIFSAATRTGFSPPRSRCFCFRMFSARTACSPCAASQKEAAQVQKEIDQINEENRQLQDSREVTENRSVGHRAHRARGNGPRASRRIHFQRPPPRPMARVAIIRSRGHASPRAEAKLMLLACSSAASRHAPAKPRQNFAARGPSSAFAPSTAAPSPRKSPASPSVAIGIVCARFGRIEKRPYTNSMCTQ